MFSAYTLEGFFYAFFTVQRLTILQFLQRIVTYQLHSEHPSKNYAKIKTVPFYDPNSATYTSTNVLFSSVITAFINLLTVRYKTFSSKKKHEAFTVETANSM